MSPELLSVRIMKVARTVRDALNLDAGDMVELIDKDDYVIIKKIKT